MTKISDDTSPLDDDEEIESQAPEQQATYKWEFHPRQQKKWGEITRQGLIIGRGTRQRIVPPDEVYRLASLGCSNREIAEWFGVHENTMSYNFKEYIAKAREETKQRLRQVMLKTAFGGNATLMIFLAKNMLGMSDNPISGDSDRILPWSDQ